MNQKYADSYEAGEYGCLWCDRYFSGFKYYLQHACVKNGRGRQVVDFIGTFDYGKQPSLRAS